MQNYCKYENSQSSHLLVEEKDHHAFKTFLYLLLQVTCKHISESAQRAPYMLRWGTGIVPRAGSIFIKHLMERRVQMLGAAAHTHAHTDITLRKYHHIKYGDLGPFSALKGLHQ